MFLWDWFNSLLSYFNLNNKKCKLAFVGLDFAGKTTLLYMLKENRMSQSVPTCHPTTEELSLGGVKFITYDLGGHKQVRRVWRDYYPAVDAFVFLIDVADNERLEEAKMEFEGLLMEKSVTHCPILILGNKIDKPTAISEEQLKSELSINGLTTGKGIIPKDKLCNRPMEVFMCSILQHQGYGEGFRWLSQYVE